MDSETAQGFHLPYSGTVLEVKTVNYVPEWVEDLVTNFDLQQSGNCKYSTAIWRDGLFAGHPGVNAQQLELLNSI